MGLVKSKQIIKLNKCNMNKNVVLFLLIFASVAIYAQNYKICFSGIGACNTVDSVRVENLAQCKSFFLSGKDTLHLTSEIIPDAMTMQSNTSGSGKKNVLSKYGKLAGMKYNFGERLKITGFSKGIYRTVVTLVPERDTTIVFNFVACTDADNNHYAVVQIGTQLWMAENLNTTKYSNGDSIIYYKEFKKKNNTNKSKHGLYYDCGNNPDNGKIYGKLYNWYAVHDSRKIAPKGWHVPTTEEWGLLTSYLGGESVAGGKLKGTCSSFWQNPNSGATNETGFTALPAGIVCENSKCYLGESENWWCSTQCRTTVYSAIECAWSREVLNNSCAVTKDEYLHKANGFSVRCVKDR